jgi:hypothetical protein
MIALVVGSVTAFAACFSLIFVGIQARELTRQTKHSNAINTASTIHDVLDRLHQANLMIFDRPELIPYFYHNVSCPRRGKNRVRAQMVLEVLADSLDYGLAIASVMPEAIEYIDYDDYVSFLLQHSPLLRETLENHPDWWKRLRRKYLKECRSE